MPKLAGYSDIGGRQRNEDSYTVKEFDNGWLIAVADGLGGHPRGDEASQAAVAAIDDFQPGETITQADFVTIYRDACDRVDALRSHGRDVSPNEARFQFTQPATTLTMAAGFNDEVWLVNLGDSRAYLVDSDSTLLQATEPHNSEDGLITKCLGAFGFEPPDVITLSVDDIPAGSRLVCATDGVWGQISDFDEDYFFDLIAKSRSTATGLAKGLVNDAVKLGGGYSDNATVALALF